MFGLPSEPSGTPPVGMLRHCAIAGLASNSRPTTKVRVREVIVRSIVLHSVATVSSYPNASCADARRFAAPCSRRSAGRVGLAETVSAVGDRECAIGPDGGTDPVPFAVGRVLEVRDHVFGCIRGL